MFSEVEARFISLMTELFQLREAEELDFGVYRLIRRHNRKVRDFLGDVVQENGKLVLRGGELSAIFDNEFRQLAALTLEDQKRIFAALGAELGLRSGDSDKQIEERLSHIETAPMARHKVAEYRAMRSGLLDAYGAGADRAEVLNRLLEFYGRHYQDWDFIVQRRFGKDGARYVKSIGEDTEFRWATEDMYYIKSGDIFTDYEIRLSNGKRLRFAVDAAVLANR